MKKTEKYSALIAGVSLILMAIAAGFAYGYVYSNLVVKSESLTFNNLLENMELFSAGIAAWIVIFVLDLLVSFGLYVYFKHAQKLISLITALIRVVYTVILGIAIYQLFIAEVYLQHSDAALDVYKYLLRFESIWSLGLILFGVHLIGLAYLASVSSRMPRIFSYLLYLAGLAYIFIHGLKQLDFVGEEFLIHAEMVLSLPMALGELILAIWLIFKGLRK
jgi:hypothetical protein